MAFSSEFEDAALEPVPWENLRSTILGIVITALVVSALCVAARLYTRLRVVRSAGWDDLFVGLYLLTTTASCVAVCLAPNYGLGQHFFVLSPDQAENFLILFYVANATYVSSTTFIKLSLLFQYLRIYERGTAIRMSCVFLIVTIGLWGAAFSFMAWVPCFPVSGYWDADPTAKCYGFGLSLERTTFVAHTAINMVMDILVLALPIPLYFDKTSPPKTRMGMLALLTLGCLVNVFAAWRLAVLIRYQGDLIEIFDVTWHAPVTMLLSIAEVTLASICASIPIFWPVLTQSFGAIFVTKEVEVTLDDRYVWDGRPDSESSLTPNSTHKTDYHDAFVMQHVSPLQHGYGAGTSTIVESETAPEKKRWFRGGV